MIAVAGIPIIGPKMTIQGPQIGEEMVGNARKCKCTFLGICLRSNLFIKKMLDFLRFYLTILHTCFYSRALGNVQTGTHPQSMIFKLTSMRVMMPWFNIHMSQLLLRSMSLRFLLVCCVHTICN